MKKIFKISELFNVSTTKSVDRNKIQFVVNGDCDFIGRSSSNYGIQGTMNRMDYAPNPAKTFSLVQVGESVCLYREREWYASQNIFILTPFDNRLCDVHLYIEASINAYLSALYSSAYTYPKLSDVKEIPITLPVTSDDQIDFEYMEERISELEAERISELEAFLVATGLNDYELTEDDRQILHSALMAGAESQSLTSSDSCLKWERKYKEFRVGDILNVEQTLSVVSKSDLIEGDIPYVTRTSTNNGYMSTCGNISQLNKGNCITVGAETGIAFYQPSDFVAGNKIYRLSRNGLNEKMYLYLATVLNAHTKNYSYSNARIPSKIKEEIVILPIIPDTTNQIDFEYMERYIKAIEKTVIANVVKYKDQVIEETKKVVANNATT